MICICLFLLKRLFSTINEETRTAIGRRLEKGDFMCIFENVPNQSKLIFMFWFSSSLYFPENNISIFKPSLSHDLDMMNIYLCETFILNVGWWWQLFCLREYAGGVSVCYWFGDSGSHDTAVFDPRSKAHAFAICHWKVPVCRELQGMYFRCLNVMLRHRHDR